MTMTANPTKNKATIRRMYDECLNTGKLDMLDQFIAPEFSFQGAKGPSAYGKAIGELREGFPDIKWTIEDLVAEGDRVVVRATWKGTHDGTFRTFTPTHKKLTNTAIAVYQLDRDKVINVWLETDRLGFLQQIGLIPVDITTLQKK